MESTNSLKKWKGSRPYSCYWKTFTFYLRSCTILHAYTAIHTSILGNELAPFCATLKHYMKLHIQTNSYEIHHERNLSVPFTILSSIYVDTSNSDQELKAKHEVNCTTKGQPYTIKPILNQFPDVQIFLDKSPVLHFQLRTHCTVLQVHFHLEYTLVYVTPVFLNFRWHYLFTFSLH